MHANETTRQTQTVYVVRDAAAEYVADAATDRRTPASDEAMEFETADEARAACTRSTDRVLSRDVEIEMTANETTRQHARTRGDESSYRGYYGSVAVEPYTSENRAAHGGVVYIEKCLDCGMERSVNCNQVHYEYSPWHKSRAQLAKEEELQAARALFAEGEAAIKKRGAKVLGCTFRDGDTLVDLEVDGRRLSIWRCSIRAAANQPDTGDGLVPFYRRLLVMVDYFNIR